MIKRWSSRWIDLTRYKSKDILLSVLKARIANVIPANKSGTVYKCCCPFHYDKTPSMKFYFNKHIPGWGYKCFGCGTSGDVFSFLMRFDRLEFWDAMLYVTKDFFPNSSFSGSRSNSIQLEFHFPENNNHCNDLPY